MTFVLCLLDKSQDESQSSSNIPHGPDKENIDIRPESEVLDYHSASVSPTQPNEDINNSNPKKEVLSMDISFNNFKMSLIVKLYCQ